MDIECRSINECGYPMLILFSNFIETKHMLISLQYNYFWNPLNNY